MNNGTLQIYFLIKHCRLQFLWEGLFDLRWWVFYDLIKFVARKLQMIENAIDEKKIEIGLNSLEKNFIWFFCKEIERNFCWILS